jgi:hypothetical protein
VQQKLQAQQLLPVHDTAKRQLTKHGMSAGGLVTAGCDGAYDQLQMLSTMEPLPPEQLQNGKGQYAGKHSISRSSQKDSMLLAVAEAGDGAVAGVKAQPPLTPQDGQTQYKQQGHKQAQQDILQERQQEGEVLGKQLQSATCSAAAAVQQTARHPHCQSLPDTHAKQAANSPSTWCTSSSRKEPEQLGPHGSTENVTNEGLEVGGEMCAASSTTVAPAPAAAPAAPTQFIEQSLSPTAPGHGSTRPAEAAEAQGPVPGAKASAAVLLAAHSPDAPPPEWLCWLQLAAINPPCALSAANAVRHLRTTRHTKRLWTKAKAQLLSCKSPLLAGKPTLNRGAACGPQAPEVVSGPAVPLPLRTPAWLSWLQLAAKEPEAAAAGDASCAAQVQEHVATLAGLKQWRSWAASREATQKPVMLRYVVGFNCRSNLPLHGKMSKLMMPMRAVLSAAALL